MIEAGIGVSGRFEDDAGFEDRGRGHKPRNSGGLEGLEETRK